MKIRAQLRQYARFLQLRARTQIRTHLRAQLLANSTHAKPRTLPIQLRAQLHANTQANTHAFTQRVRTQLARTRMYGRNYVRRIGTQTTRAFTSYWRKEIAFTREIRTLYPLRAQLCAPAIRIRAHANTHANTHAFTRTTTRERNYARIYARN